MDLLYNAPEYARYVQVMAPFFFFHYFQGPLAAALQALDFAKAAMINSLIGAIVKTAAIFALASNPSLGIMGVALAIALGIVLVTMLHFATLVRAVSFKLNIRDFIKGLAVMAISIIPASMFYKALVDPDRLFESTLMAIVLTSISYLILALAIGALKKEDLKPIPVIGKWFK